MLRKLTLMFSALTLFALGPVMLLIYFVTAFVAEAR